MKYFRFKHQKWQRLTRENVIITVARMQKVAWCNPFATYEEIITATYEEIITANGQLSNSSWRNLMKSTESY